MTSTDPLDAYIDAAAEILGLVIADAWKPAVRDNLAVTLRLAATVHAFPLPDEIEPASVYKA